MSFRRQMSATWAWNTVTPWNSWQPRWHWSPSRTGVSSGGLQGAGGGGHGQAAPRKLGPSFPKSVA